MQLLVLQQRKEFDLGFLIVAAYSIHVDLHWLYVLERVKYKLVSMVLTASIVKLLST